MEYSAYKNIRCSLAKRVLTYILSALAIILKAVCRSKKNSDRVIIIEPYGMGDVISLLPLVQNLTESEVYTLFFIKNQWHDLVDSKSNLELIDCDLPWSSYNSGEKYQISSMYNSVKQLLKLRKKIAGSTGIDPRGDIRSILALYILGCSSVISLNRYLGTNVKIPKWVACSIDYSNNKRRWEIAAKMSEKIGVKAEKMPPRLRKIKSIRAFKDAIFIPIAPWRGKLWNSERWVELGCELAKMGISSKAVCGPNQDVELKRLLPGFNFLVARNIHDWITIFNDTDLVITLDSGPMHLADAMGLPLVALFGQGQLPLWAPSGSFSNIVHYQEQDGFEPCHQIDGNEHLGKVLMEKITVSDVLDSVTDLKNRLSIQ